MSSPSPLDAARTLTTRLGTGALDPGDELGESALEAVALAIDALYADAGEAVRETLELDLAFGAGSASLVHGARDMPAVEAGSWMIAYTLEGEGSLARDRADRAGRARRFADAGGRVRGSGRRHGDAARLAVERASAIAADADRRRALGPLLGGALGRDAHRRPARPIRSQVPRSRMIAAEVSYLAGLEGSNRFLLAPADAAQLAAAMMGTPETTGDGLSAIELSAVSEAMNQVMSATASELSSALGIAIEASPPICTIIEDGDQARELLGTCAYRSSFRLVSTIFSAEIVQLVSPELAASLGEVFASSALAQEALDAGASDPDAFADLPLSGFEGALPDPPDPGAGARELLSGIRVRVSAELGRSRLPIARVANLPARLDRGARPCAVGSRRRARQRHAVRAGQGRARRRRVRRADRQPLAARAERLSVLGDDALREDVRLRRGALRRR